MLNPLSRKYTCSRLIPQSHCTHHAYFGNNFSLRGVERDMTLQSLELNIPSFTVKHTFTSKRSARVTTIFEQPYVQKFFSPNHPHKNEWINEHEVLTYLASTNVDVPRSYGYRKDRAGAFLYKEYIPGQTITRYTKEKAKKLAQLFANLHTENVVTRDAHDGNIIKTKERNLVFLDFGKAVIFQKKNTKFWLTVCREMFFIKTKVIKDDAIYTNFEHYYLKTQPQQLQWLLHTCFSVVNATLQLRDDLRRRFKRKNNTI